MVKLIVVRHGHIAGIDPERFRGRKNVPLTAEGHRQASATAESIASRWQPVIIYTSPLQRCLETAGEIAKSCAVDMVVLEDLSDLDYGAWQWLEHATVRAQWPQLLERWLATPHLVRFPEGESLQDLLARTANVIRLALERHTEDTVVLVSHESVIRALLLQLLDQPLCAYWRLSPQPGSISEVALSGHGATVIRINETHHLDLVRCRT